MFYPLIIMMRPRFDVGKGSCRCHFWRGPAVSHTGMYLGKACQSKIRSIRIHSSLEKKKLDMKRRCSKYDGSTKHVSVSFYKRNRPTPEIRERLQTTSESDVAPGLTGSSGPSKLSHDWRWCRPPSKRRPRGV